MIDYKCEEAQILNNWGIEGEHYQLDEDGNRYLTEEQREERRSDSTFGERTGINVFTAYGPHYGDGVLDSTGQPFTVNTPESLIADYTEVGEMALKVSTETDESLVIPKKKKNFWKTMKNLFSCYW